MTATMQANEIKRDRSISYHPLRLLSPIALLDIDLVVCTIVSQNTASVDTPSRTCNFLMVKLARSEVECKSIGPLKAAETDTGTLKLTPAACPGSTRTGLVR